MATIALDATYTVGPEPSGIAVYSRRLIESLATLETRHRFLVCYRLSRLAHYRDFLRPVSPSPSGPRFSTRVFQERLTFWLPRQAELFHSLAQRPPAFRFRREVVTVHDVFPLTGRDYSTPDFCRKFGALILEAVRRAGRIITPSQYTAAQLAAHAGAAREKIRVIPEGVDPPAALLGPEERRAERAHVVGEGHEMLLTVGAIQARKNTLGALKALALLPERYVLVLAGGDGYGSQAVHEFIRKEGLGSRVIRLGYIAPERLRALYQSASLLLFPSFEEGFGLPVLEAMASGLPVVASQAASLPEVGGNAALYVDPHDIRDIAEKTQRAVEEAALRGKMIQAGLARAREFTWRRTAEMTLKVYDEVLAE